MRKFMLLGFAMLFCGAAGASAQAVGGESNRPAVRINGEITVTGCVMTESDYRTLRSGGGLLGSRVGAGDLVLGNATPSVGGRGARRGGDRVEARPIEDDSPLRPGTRNYVLDGSLEQELGGNMWRLARVVGTVEATATTNPEGAVDELPRLTITSWENLAEVCLK